MTLASLPDHLHEFSQTLTPGPIAHLGTRYNAEGTFLPEPGNTIVCHLTENALSQQAVVDARERYFALPEVEKLSFTPIASLHMTLFQGIIEYRRRLPFWPEDIPLETPIEDMTALYLDRLRGFEPCGKFNVCVTHATPNGLKLAGATQADRDMLKLWRDRFADIFGYRHPDHETYEFHITFTYVLERLSDEAIKVWQLALEEIVEELQERAPVIEMNAPAFCSFEDMNHFEELLVFE
jgi:hypothetical protein